MSPDDTTLRTLDAAPAALNAAEHQRGADLLERIVSEVAAPSPAPARRGSVPARDRPTRPWRSRRLLIAPLAVLALVTALVLVPSPGPDRTAYASWTSVPTAADDQSLDAAASQCGRQILAEGRQADGAPPLDLGRTRQFLAERRGDFVLVVHWSPTTDTTVQCVVHNPPGTDDVDSLNLSSGGSSGLVAPAAGTLSLGGISDGTGGAQRLVRERQAWWTPYADRLSGLLADRHPFRGSVVDGLVGEGVSGVTVHAGAYTVEATVAGGKYVAWWPGTAMDCALQDSGVPRCDPIMTYDLHLADGTTITDAQPAHRG